MFLFYSNTLTLNSNTFIYTYTSYFYINLIWFMLISAQMIIEAESYSAMHSICFTITPPTGIALHWPQISGTETWWKMREGNWNYVQALTKLFFF